MDVVQVNHLHRPSLGGIENYSHRLAGSLRERGHGVSVITTDASLRNDASPLDVEEGVRYCRTLASPFRNPLSLELYRRVKQTDADVYHVHSPWFLTSLAAVAAVPRDAPVVMTVHGFQPIQGLVGRTLETAYRPIARRIMDRVDRVIVLGEPERRRLVAEYGVDPDRVVVVPNGIVVAERDFDPDWIDDFHARYGLDPAVPTVLCVSRLVPLKRTHLLVDAVTEHLSDTPIQVVIVGHGDSEYASRLRERADERVHFLSNLSDEELRAAYAAADAFVLLSAAEGLPTVVLEAMSVGLPVVATPAGAVADVIVDGENGRLLDPDPTAADVADALSALLADPVELAAIGDRNQTAIRERFDWELIADRIVEVYEDAIGAAAARTGTSTPIQAEAADAGTVARTDRREENESVDRPAGDIESSSESRPEHSDRDASPFG
jgi:glycosyltransferase involved in cell wall biosynthesis